MNDTFQKDRPICFGQLEQVFPKGEDGLRQPPETCLMCYFKTECLRTAIHGKDRATLEEERVDRAYESGQIGFFRRWSQRKALFQQKKRKITQKKDGSG